MALLCYPRTLSVILFNSVICGLLTLGFFKLFTSVVPQLPATFKIIVSSSIAYFIIEYVSLWYHRRLVRARIRVLKESLKKAA